MASDYATTNPYTGKTTKRYETLADADVPGVLDRASRGFAQWRDTSVQNRAAIVGRAAELLRERKAQAAALVTEEMGKLIAESEGEVDLSADILAYYAEHGPGQIADEPVEIEAGEAVLVTQPLGVLVGVMPWNFPYYQVVRFAAPNLVVGNAILLKHAEINPQCAEFMEELFREAGLPEGVYQNVFATNEQVARLIESDVVQGASLTGSEGAGQSVGETAGKNLKKVVLELGGSDPFIVLDDHDLENTVASAVRARMANTGQSCVAGKRFIVLDEVFDAFVEGFGKAMAELQPGDPADAHTTLGPLSTQDAADGLAEQVQDAIGKGAQVVTGGGPIDREGAFFQPTVLTGVNEQMRAYEEELFGPVAVVYRVESDEEALTLANASQYGLGSSVYASDLDRARRLAARLENGMVWINHPTATSPELPFGGVKRSGVGRELSSLGIQEFTNKKLIATLPAGTKAGTVGL